MRDVLLLLACAAAVPVIYAMGFWEGRKHERGMRKMDEAFDRLDRTFAATRRATPTRPAEGAER